MNGVVSLFHIARQCRVRLLREHKPLATHPATPRHECPSGARQIEHLGLEQSLKWWLRLPCIPWCRCDFPAWGMGMGVCSLVVEPAPAAVLQNHAYVFKRTKLLPCFIPPVILVLLDQLPHQVHLRRRHELIASAHPVFLSQSWSRCQ